MFGEDEEESVSRARFLMSPYNLTEARRQHLLKKQRWYCYSIVGMVGAAIFILWYWH